MTTSFVERALPSAPLMLTVKLDGAPAVHLVYADTGRVIEDTSVTILDQGTHTTRWSFDDVMWVALMFLTTYYAERKRWPAELRAPGAGRTTTNQAS
jgi:hypothetical protein